MSFLPFLGNFGDYWFQKVTTSPLFGRYSAKTECSFGRTFRFIQLWSSTIITPSFVGSWQKIDWTLFYPIFEPPESHCWRFSTIFGNLRPQKVTIDPLTPGLGGSQKGQKINLAPFPPILKPSRVLFLAVLGVFRQFLAIFDPKRSPSALLTPGLGGSQKWQKSISHPDKKLGVWATRVWYGHGKYLLWKWA